VSVARFIADQRTLHRVPHTITCALLGVSVSWFYKWAARTPTPTELRRARVVAPPKSWRVPYAASRLRAAVS
jgi:putative transposase